jgi:NADPH-dependent curcumin reductase
MNRRWVLARRPQGVLQQRDLALQDAPLPPLAEGELAVRNLYLSIDPTTRLWMSDVDQHATPMAIGDAVRSFVWGEVTQSKSPKHKEGDIVFGLGAWEDQSILRGATAIPDHFNLPLSAHASVLGLTGLTAYFGLLDVGQPKPGETVVTSAAAGAVGSIAAQIARIVGCRSVGIVGSEAKAALLTDEYGLAAAINRKRDLQSQLKQTCPDGVDVGFENVAGPVLDAVLGHINPAARIVLCGMISGYESAAWPTNMLRPILMKRARIEGVLISSYFGRLSEGVAQLADWVKAGELKWRVDVMDGLEAAPAALLRVLAGQNDGKQLVRLAQDPWG